jgi:colanic acid biosynthesis glycosyl transferase WcaI
MICEYPASRDSEAERRRMPSVLFLNRSYWPDSEATGQLLSELCEDLATEFNVTVIAGQPNCNPTAARYRRRGIEIRDHVRIRRVWHSWFAKQSLPGRLINYLSFLLSAFWAAVWAKRPDVVVVETDPPLLCLIGWYLKRVRGAKLVVYLQDIHPDIAIAIGKIRNGRVTRMLRRLMVRSYRSADRVVVLSRDMRQRVIDAGVTPERVVCIPNWIDTQQVQPVKHFNPFRERHCRGAEFVAMYSGNLGLCQRLEDVIAAASHLRDRPDILFLFVGEGALKRRLIEQVLELGLSNVRFLPYQPKANLSESLSAADVQLVPLDPRVASCLMPSKLYGALASGTPLVTVAPDDCELAELTREHRIGVVAPPGQPEILADMIRNLADRPWDLCEMGVRARRLAEVDYDRKSVTARFAELLKLFFDGRPCVKPEGKAVPSVQPAEIV